MIYSYSKKGGEYYGTRAYIANWFGMSLSSVDRALKALTRRGLIEKTEKGSYRVTDSAITAAREQMRQKDEQESKSIAEQSNCTSDSTNLTANKQFNIQKITSTSSSSCALRASERGAEKKREEKEKRHSRYGTKFDVITVGYHRIIRMTSDQYYALLDLIPEEDLENYIMKLEAMMMTLRTEGTPHIHSPYKTLKKWIEEEVQCCSNQ